MDELTFRRHVLADPYSVDPEIVRAAHEDPAKKQFWQEIKQQETELQAVLSVPVPDDLADKLLWQQASHSRPVLKQPRVWYATAASVMLVITASWIGLNTPKQRFYDDALAHVQHVSEHEITGELVSLASLNTKLARFGGIINEAFGHILSANFCVIDGVESLHVQMGNPDNPTSIFVLPKDVDVTGTLNDKEINGKILEYQAANILIMGTVSDTFSNIADHFAQHVAFTR